MPKPKNLEETAYRYIKNQIHARQWLPQTHITEQKLSKELAISRTPVRYAFQRLQAEGYLEIEPHKGARIKEQPIDSRGIQERLEFIELFLVNYFHYLQIKELSIQNHGIEEILAELLAVADGTEKEYIKQETRFIHQLLTLSKNRFSASLVMDTIRELQLQEDHDYRDLMYKNREVKNRLYQKIVLYLTAGEYALARKETRILINQLTLSVIHGMQ
ncbi:MAG: GntR family transcriptional regulator [Carnobacterium sp.]|uniref:GntR family transcriptional regulator n=1 Tax=Carnobacterium sp. TaxID=48221 RepID=UPI002FCA0CA6